mmetsp:Transcript_9647/g.22161  ORF Transcript_9647/g.22161 Transcript_9647/m.22161 type:complete len:90 (-) Transcript_9647:376-645(-)
MGPESPTTEITHHRKPLLIEIKTYLGNKSMDRLYPNLYHYVLLLGQAPTPTPQRHSVQALYSLLFPKPNCKECSGGRLLHFASSGSLIR